MLDRRPAPCVGSNLLHSRPPPSSPTMPRTLLPLALLALSTACAHWGAFPAADTDLALRRVVLYRNGIGYFERHGEVDDQVLRVKVRRDQIDDLLKSLTVIDRRTGKAVSVSMPLDPESWATTAGWRGLTFCSV